MSRIGEKPIEIPAGVAVDVGARRLKVRGRLGELSVPVPGGISAEREGRTLRIRCAEGTRTAFQGLTRALAANAVAGVMKKFTKRLQIVGVGYRARLVRNVLVLQLGYSHPIEVLLPDGVEAKVEANTRIVLSGIDKQLVNQTAANIRSLRKPDPYKQKGVRYEGERLRSKEGKSGVS